MNDKQIYQKAKEKIYSIYSKPSAYRSSALVREEESTTVCGEIEAMIGADIWRKYFL